MKNELWEYFKSQYPDMVKDIVEWIELGVYELYLHLEDDQHLIYDPDYGFTNISNNVELTDDVKAYRFRIALNKKTKKARINYSRVAKRAGVDGSSMYKYRDGKLLPNDKIIQKLSHAFNCSPNDFYEI